MALKRLFPPGYVFQRKDGQGPSALGVVSFFENETSTLATVYQDTDKTPADNPATLTASGRLPTAYFTDKTVRVKHVDPEQLSSAQVFQEDDVCLTEQQLVYTTLAALKEATLDDLDSAYVKGYGRYFYDASSTATANGTTIVTPDSGIGRLILDAGLEVTVLDYGAVGDGTTDDTAALTAAFAAGVGRLVDGKTYMADALPIANALHLTGNATIKARATSGALSLLDITSGDVAIDGITVDLDNTTDSYIADRIGIKAQGTSGAHISGLKFSNITVKNAGMTGLYFRYADYIEVDNADLSRCGEYGAAFWTCNNFRVRGSKAKNIYPGTAGSAPYLNCYGFAASNFSGDAVCTDFEFVDCFAEDIPSWEGFDTHYGQRGRFVNCSTKNCNTGVVVQSTDAATGTPSEDIQIVGGHHEGYGTGYSAKSQTWNTGAAVVANMGNSSTNGRGLVVRGVTSNDMGDGRGSGAAAIKVEACDDWTVVDCILNNSIGYGFLANASCINGIVNANQVIGIVESSNGNKRGFVFDEDSSASMDNCLMSDLPSGAVPISMSAPTATNLGVMLGANNRVVGGELFTTSNFQNLRPGSAFLGAAREAIAFNGSGGVAITSRYGYEASDAPVVRNGAGDYTLTFKNTFVLNPRVVLTGFSPMIEIEALSTTSVQIITRNTAGTATDDAGLNIAVFGA